MSELDLIRLRAQARARAIQETQNGHDVPEFVPPGVVGYDPKTGNVTRSNPAKAALFGTLNTGGFGFGDEIVAGGLSLIDKIPGIGKGRSYEDALKLVRREDQRSYDEHPGAYIGGMGVGALGGGIGLAKTGLSLAGKAISRGAGLGRVAGASAADGAVIGAITGAGAGEGIVDRAKKAAIGLGIGGTLGLAAPVAMAGAGAVASPIVSALTARLRPDTYANRALSAGLQRSGMTSDDIADQLLASRADGQDVFAVADAMGNSGQRMLSTVTRTPNEARQGVADALLMRQAGQGRRVTNALSEGFAAPDTATQRTVALTQARETAADQAYAAARKQAGAVDVSAAIQRADEILAPGVNPLMSPRDNIAADSVEGALTRARAFLTDGRSNLTDFNSVFRAKEEIGDMIDAAMRVGRKHQAGLLGQVRDEIDNALANSSAPYAAARDQFRQGSQTIEAVEQGKLVAQRGRSEDTIPAFQAMRPEQQAAFRAGYSDPLIAQAQGAPVGVNKARPLINDATTAEFPAFAAPGEGGRLGRRIAREQTMFTTTNAALGGSKTADNLADMAEMGQFDPSIIMQALSGRPVAAIVTALTKVLNEGRGMPPSVLSRVGKALTETNPDVARTMLDAASSRSGSEAKRRAITNAILNGLGGSAAGRIPAP